jgi:DNA-binding CsgD family transcriptional regulator
MALVEQRLASLTAREQEVMALVVAGRRNKQIAADLGVNEITVKAHRDNVMRKMNAQSLADLVRMANTLPATRRKSQADNTKGPRDRSIRSTAVRKLGALNRTHAVAIALRKGIIEV